MSYVIQWRTKSQEDLINKVKSNLDSIKMNFFEIAAYLYEAHERMFYHGYPTIVEFSAENFGFEKTLTYDLIKMFKTFRQGNSYLPDQNVTHLNQTQLIALCSCQAGRNALATIIQPNDTIKNVKRAVKIFNSLSIQNRNTFKATTLDEFFEEFPEKTIDNKKEDLYEEGKKLLDKLNFSAQTENKKTWKPVPIRDYVIDVMGEENTNAFAKSLAKAIENLKDCIDLFTVGCEYSYQLREAKEQCQKLFNRFYYGKDEQNI